MALNTGLTASVSLEVSEGDTALALGSGDVPVLATPRVISLCEEATCAVVAGRLENGTTSVAKRIQIDHLAPVAVGGSVRAEAVLERIEGRRLTFSLSVSDAHGLVAAGKVTRIVVDRQRFLENAH